MKFENPASRYAIVGVFLVQSADGVRIGVTGATSCAHRGLRLEEALIKNLSSGIYFFKIYFVIGFFNICLFNCL